jgi:D-alanyl-D-alanine carboxypeptidase
MHAAACGSFTMQTTQPLVTRARAAAIAYAVAITTISAGCGSSSTASAAGSKPPTQPAATQAATARPSPSPSLPSDLAGVLAQLAEANHGGAIALVVSPEKTWRGASGKAGDGSPPEPTARFGIASDTKTFTATIVLQLVGEGRLALDDTVEKRLPGRVRDGERITIRQLLNHTSGIVQGMSGVLPSPDTQPGLRYEPGTTHSYSNTNYLILGLIAEELTGERLDDLVLDRIFRPLRLEDSSFGSASLETPESSLPPWLGTSIESQAYSGAGGIVSTADDLATFYRALLGGKLLAEAQLGEMLKTVDTDTDPLAGQGPGHGWAGLGIFRIELDCGMPWGHGGDYPSYSNQVLATRDGSKVVVVAQNVMGWPAASATAAKMFCL